MTPAVKLLLSAYKAQQAWRNLPPQERQRIIAAARDAVRQPRPATAERLHGSDGAADAPSAGAAGAPTAGAPSSSVEARPPTAAERAQAAAAIAATIARQQGPVIMRQALHRASANAGLAGRIAGAVVRAQAKRSR